MADWSIGERSSLIELASKPEFLRALSKFCDHKADEFNQQCCRLMRQAGNETEAHTAAVHGLVWENLVEELKSFAEKLKL